jgi:hypothetical protein
VTRVLLVLVALAGTARGEPDQLSRLEGHRAQIGADGTVQIFDVAGEGRPEVGVVVRAGRFLDLRRADGTLVRLVGPLAVPRIAGPGYKIWVLGRRDRTGALVARRLGVLARPR